MSHLFHGTGLIKAPGTREWLETNTAVPQIRHPPSQREFDKKSTKNHEESVPKPHLFKTDIFSSLQSYE